MVLIDVHSLGLAKGSCPVEADHFMPSTMILMDSSVDRVWSVSSILRMIVPLSGARTAS